jgi:diguanylate cyclase (GGDEF)-like protein/PAS domain S-box-containing protein
VNPAFEQITGYTLAEIKGRDPRFMRIEGCDTGEHQRIHEALQRAAKACARCCATRARTASVFWNELRIDPVANRTAKSPISSASSTTSPKRATTNGACTTWPTTIPDGPGQPHPAAGPAQAGDPVRACATARGALAFLDLDNFKHINDNFGHDAGDAVLREIAGACVPTCARATPWRGSAATSSCSSSTTSRRNKLADLVERIRQQRVGAPVVAGGTEIVPGTSIGVALFPHDGNTVDKVMRAADAAMYHAKTLGKNNCQFYSAS